MAGPTLDELEGVEWGEPTYPSGLVVRCHELRRKPVDEFTLADMRLLVGQSISLPILMPRAVSVVGADPLAEASGYPGDLLNAVLRADPAFLQASPDLLGQVRSAAGRAEFELRAGAVDLDPQSREELLAEIASFLASSGDMAEPIVAPHRRSL